MLDDVPLWYLRTTNRLRVHGLKDLSTEEVFLTTKAARTVLGQRLHVAKGDQVRVLQELEAYGLLSIVNKRLIKIK